jgi:putative metallohydrolase (TIGR04338 family)
LLTVHDFQRYRLYNGEIDVFGNAEEDTINAIGNRKIEETQRFVDDVVRDRDVLDVFLLTPQRGIEVKDAHADFGSASYLTKTIWMPEHTRTSWYALHEVAHIIDGMINTDCRVRGAHNWKFASIYLELIRLVMGNDEFLMMQDSFDQNNVNYRTSLNGRLVLG